MKILGIESSCDETAAAVVDGDAFVHSSVVASQIPIHRRYGGVVPELASRNHLVQIRPVIAEALDKAGTTLAELDAIAVTAGPGLGGCLLVGLQVAKALAYTQDKPLILVDHIHAHIWSAWLHDTQFPRTETLEIPYIALAVSGGHTSLYRVDGPEQMTRLGGTLDDAAGEAFDKIAKEMGLPYPGGVCIDAEAKHGDASTYDLPRPMRYRGLDFSFSGLKTAARLQWEDATRELKPEALPAMIPDMAASVQGAIVDVLVEKTLRACDQEKLRHIVVAGGVACNSALRKEMLAQATAKGFSVSIPPPRYCSDNAAMVAGLGAALHKAGRGLVGAALREAEIYVTNRRRRL